MQPHLLLGCRMGWERGRDTTPLPHRHGLELSPLAAPPSCRGGCDIRSLHQVATRPAKSQRARDCGRREGWLLGTLPRPLRGGTAHALGPTSVQPVAVTMSQTCGGVACKQPEFTAHSSGGWNLSSGAPRLCRTGVGVSAANHTWAVRSHLTGTGAWTSGSLTLRAWLGAGHRVTEVPCLWGAFHRAREVGG